MKDLISVIVPIYKVEQYLAKCIESILAQTYRDIEVILVDDGSPDNCGAICDEYSRKDDRIRVLHKENGGLSAARNAGIDVACGAYIAFIDSDDYIAPKMIETLYGLIKRDSSDMAICNFSYVDESGKRIDKLNAETPIKNEVISRKNLLEKLINDKSWYYVVAVNKLYKKEIFTSIRFPIKKLHEDEFVIHHIIDMCEKISCIATSLYYYVQRTGSIMNKPYSIKRLDIIEAYIDRVSFFLEHGSIYCAEKTSYFILGNLKNARRNLDFKSRESKKRYYQLLGIFKKIYFKKVFKKISLKSKAHLSVFCISPLAYEMCLIVYAKVLKLVKRIAGNE